MPVTSIMRGHSGESFKTEFTNPVEPIGKEKW
jgi:hypothetical protein